MEGAELWDIVLRCGLLKGYWDMHHMVFDNEGDLGLSMETTNNEFYSGLKGFHGDDLNFLMTLSSCL